MDVKSYKLSKGYTDQEIEILSERIKNIENDNIATYMWIKYADTPTSGMSDSPEGKTYIGIAANKTTETESLKYSDYQWSLLKGEKGNDGNPGYTPVKGVDYFDGKDGQNGKNSFLWIKYSQNANGNPTTSNPAGAKYIGIATTDTAAEPSSYTAYQWSLIKGTDGIPGEPGKDGKTSYLHIKYSNDGGVTFTGNNGEDVGDYIGTYVDFIEADSNSISAYIWNRIKGNEGPQGIEGPKGKDGQQYWTWIKYASSINGADMSDSPEGKSYIGIAYNKTTSIESNFPSDYTWSLFIGPQGIQGEPGDDGQPTYTWIKYADSPTTGMSDNPSGKAYMGIAYNKLTQIESTNYNDYSWSLIKGEQGIQGIQGIQGPPGSATYTWVKYADDSSGNGMSDLPDNKSYIGLAYNKTSASESTIASDYTWSLIKGDRGPEGPKGPDGETYYTWLKYADTPTTGMSDDPTGKLYMGIAYNKPVALESNNYNDYTWSLIKGDKGNPGDNAKYVVLSGEQAFKYPTGAAAPTNTTISLSATAYNITSPKFQWQYWNGTAWTNLSKTGNNTQNYIVAYNDTEWGSNNLIRYRCFVDSLYADEITLVKLYDGAKGVPALFTVLTNDSHTITTDSNGNNGNYNNSGLDIYVYEGTSVLTYNGTGTANGTWKISAVGSGITASTTFTNKTTYVTVGNHSNMTADTAAITYTIDGKRLDGTAFSLTVKQTFSKSKQGQAGYTPVKGTDYFDGQPGQNGTSSYLWIRYSQNSNGNPMTTDPTGAKYIGVANTTTNTAPTGYASYSWSLVKGTDGLPGESGIDGQTSYLHIKYSNDGGKTFTTNSGEDVGDWIGTYVDFNIADSMNVTSYTWNKVKGDPGTDAKLLFLSASNYTMTFTAAGVANPSSQTITFTANLQNVTGTATFTAIPYNSAGTALTAITLGGTGNSRTLTSAQWPSTAVKVIVTASLSGLTDSSTIVQLKDGAQGGTGAPGVDAIVGFLTNESITLSATTAGVVSNFSSATGTFELYDGITRKTGTSVAYAKTAESGCTASINTSGVYSITAMSADTATATFTATYNGVTITKIVSLSKSKTGDTGSQGVPGAPGANAIIGVLSNESAVVPANTDGSVISFAGTVTTMYIYNGATDDSANWTVTVLGTPSGLAGTLSGKTYTVTSMSADVGYVDLKASRNGYSDVVKRFTVTKSKTGATGGTGSPGQNATAYWLVVSTPAISKALSGAYTPATVTVTGKSQTGTGSPGDYSAKFIISESTDGINFVDRYTTAATAGEITKTHTPSASIKSLRIRMYVPNSTTLLDEQTIPIVNDGPTGPQGPTGPKGADGTIYYTWIKYADTATGSGISDSPTNKSYIGIAYNKTTSTMSNVASDYTWSLFLGPQGVTGPKGTDGTTTYTWIKYADDDQGNGISDSPVNKRFLGLAYNKTTSIESTNKADYSWSPLYDNVVVGGRNYFKNTTQVNRLTNAVTIERATSEAPNGFKLTGQKDLLGAVRIPNIINSTGEWTISFKCRSNGTNTINFDACDSVPKSIVVTTTEQKFTITLNVTQYTPELYHFIDINNLQWLYYWFTDFKVEKGNVATDWTPAPEDIQSQLDDISSDNRLTPSEKQDVKKEWDIIAAEKPTLDAQATTYGVTTEKTNYGTSYTTLSNYISPLIANLTTTSDIIGSTFRSNFKDYYDKKALLQKAITDAAKNYTDGAVGGIQVGGKNILLNSSMGKDISKWATSSASYSFTTSDGYPCLKIVGTKGGTHAVNQSVLGRLEAEQVYTLSGWWKLENISKGTTNYTIMFYTDGYYDNNGVSTWYGFGAKEIDATKTGWQYVSFQITPRSATYGKATSAIIHAYTRDYTGNVYIRDLKLEKGNKATDWTPAIEDGETIIATLNNDSYVVQTDNAGNNGNYSGAATTMSIYSGTIDDSSNWTVTAVPSSGVTGSLSGKTYTVINMTVDTGYVDLTAKRTNYPDKVKRFTITKAKQGIQGPSGKGVSSIIEEYYLSTSATTQTGGSWVTSPPAWIDGRFIWTRSKITYTDSTTATTSPVNVTGGTGGTGATGNGISSVDVQYYLSTSATALSGGAWSTTAPAWVDGKYMWSKTVTKYTNNTTVESNPVCITGGKGNTGSPGVSVSSIVEEYYYSTSATTQTGGAWSTTYPSWVDGKYLWTRAKTTFSDASTSYTTPINVTGQKGTNGVTTYTWIKYGDDANGSGLSDSPSGKRFIGIAHNKTSSTESTTASDYTWSPLYDNVKPGGRNLVLNSNTVVTTSSYAMISPTMSENWIAGETYTLVMKATPGAGKQLGLWQNSGTVHKGYFAFTNGVGSITFTATAPTAGWEKTFTIYNYPSGVVATSTIEWMALYKGNVALDWTPAPEDITTAISRAQQSADGKNVVYRQSTQPPTTGRVVGDMWFHTGAGNKMYVWTGAWTETKLDYQALNVGKLSAISADLGNVTAGNITGVNISTSGSSGTLSLSNDRFFSKIDYGQYAYTASLSGGILRVTDENSYTGHVDWETVVEPASITLESNAGSVSIREFYGKLLVDGGIKMDAFTNASMLNGWVTESADSYPAGYVKDPFGFVHIRGRVKGGTLSQAMFTLPSGYRPKYTVFFSIYGGSVVQTTQTFRVMIKPTGEVMIYGATNTVISLEGIYFMTE